MTVFLIIRRLQKSWTYRAPVVARHSLKISQAMIEIACMREWFGASVVGKCARIRDASSLPGNTAQKLMNPFDVDVLSLMLVKLLPRCGCR